MRRTWIAKLVPAVMALALAMPSANPVAADLGAGAVIDRPATEDGLALALSRYHDLLAIRVTFDILPAEQLATDLAAAATRWAPSGPGAGEAAQLDNALLAEASYYLTSIAYVVEVGGAAFPDDRPYDHYRNDTLVAVDALRDRLIAALETGLPVHDILVEAQRLRWLTEGETAVPADEDRFSGHDALLAAALSQPAGLGV